MKLTSESYFLFSGGEVHYKMGTGDQSHITCLDYTMNGFMALCQHKQMLDRKNWHGDLMYPYLPYARQDRWMTEGESFSLRIFCQLLNSQNFRKVIIWDAHSDVGPALINNCLVIPQWKLATQCIPFEYLADESTVFVSPDAGAYKKVSQLIKDDKRIAIGVKHRDALGNIVHTDVFSPVDLEGRSCVIVDDICDGGRTFIELAKALRAKGAKHVALYITHGIFSKGFDELEKYIDRIYTTNSFRKQTGLPSKEYVSYTDISC